MDSGTLTWIIIVIPRNRRPTSATAWLLAVYFIPYLGWLFFLLIGSYKLPKQRRLRQQQINQFILDSTEGIERVRRDHPWPPWLEPVVRMNRSLGAMPLVGGNAASLIGAYEESLDAMTEAVNAAKRYVHVEFYILSWDDTTGPFFDALGMPTGPASAPSDFQPNASRRSSGSARQAVASAPCSGGRTGARPA